MGENFFGDRRFRILDSPIGRLAMVVKNGALIGLYTEDGIHNPQRETWGTEDGSVAADVTAQLNEYFTGRRKVFDFRTPLRPEGTTFQQKVWHAISNIEFGDTLSYGQIADALGKPLAYRAVGSATGKNPISIIVPCHRVVASDNSLGGYAGGLDVKQQLLQLEGSLDACRPGFVALG